MPGPVQLDPPELNYDDPRPSPLAGVVSYAHAPTCAKSVLAQQFPGE